MEELLTKEKEEETTKAKQEKINSRLHATSMQAAKKKGDATTTANNTPQATAKPITKNKAFTCEVQI
jgi:hypothetical protein